MFNRLLKNICYWFYKTLWNTVTAMLPAHVSFRKEVSDKNESQG